MHHIRHHILQVLSRQEWARFRDMRPPKVDSNSYSYHLKALQKEHLVEKGDQVYRLSPQGLALADRMSSQRLTLRQQPKIITMTILQDESDKVLLLAKNKQPFIGAWTLPHGKLHIEDGSVRAAARRELTERLNIMSNESLRLLANVYISVRINDVLISSVLSHIFTMKIDRSQVARTDVVWSDAKIRKSMKLAPATEEIIALAKPGKQALLLEYYIDW